MDIDNIVIGALNAQTGHHSASYVREFQVYRENAPVTVRLHTRGAFADSSTRYFAEAFWSDMPLDDRHAGTRGYDLGDDAESPEAAISIIKWNFF